MQPAVGFLTDALECQYDSIRCRWEDLATINANGFATTQVYDAIGELLAIIDARGNRNSFSYDADGRQVGLLDPLGNRITYQFDAASRQTLRIDGRGLRNELFLRSEPTDSSVSSIRMERE